MRSWPCSGKSNQLSHESCHDTVSLMPPGCMINSGNLFICLHTMHWWGPCWKQDNTHYSHGGLVSTSSSAFITVMLWDPHTFICSLLENKNYNAYLKTAKTRQENIHLQLAIPSKSSSLLTHQICCNNMSKTVPWVPGLLWNIYTSPSQSGIYSQPYTEMVSHATLELALC